MTNQNVSALWRSGWCVVEDCTSAHLVDLANELGKPVSLAAGTLTKSLFPKSKDDAPMNSMSALFGLGAFPLHTDMAHWHRPARYVLLRSVSSTSNTPTLVLDTEDFFTEELREEWARSVWKIKKIRCPFLSTIVSSSSRESFRWDPCCMFPFNKAAKELKPVIAETLEGALRTYGHAVEWSSPGMALVLDNWRVLHARPAIVDKTERRELQRIVVRGDRNGK